MFACRCACLDVVKASFATFTVAEEAFAAPPGCLFPVLVPNVALETLSVSDATLGTSIAGPSRLDVASATLETVSVPSVALGTRHVCLTPQEPSAPRTAGAGGGLGHGRPANS